MTLLPSRWRLFLNDGFATSQKIHGSKVAHRRHLLTRLNKVFGAHNLDTDSLQPAWFSRVIAQVDDPLCREVAWELSELGFMIELLMLDARFYDIRNSDPQQSAHRALCISQAVPAAKGLHVASLPTAGIGLSSIQLSGRGSALEGLRQLMLSWPDVPPSLRSYKPLELAEEPLLKRAKAEIANFYVHTFIQQAGRPPILPRQPPHVHVH